MRRLPAGLHLHDLGAFLVVVACGARISARTSTISPAWSPQPRLRGLMLIFLLSLAGIPPTAGFIGKYFIFLALIRRALCAGRLATLYVAVAIYYYFRIVRSMFVRGSRRQQCPWPPASACGWRWESPVWRLLLIGVYPEPFLRWPATSCQVAPWKPSSTSLFMPLVITCDHRAVSRWSRLHRADSSARCWPIFRCAWDPCAWVRTASCSPSRTP
jgi:NADH:ubiquinone oxidoreductase subunit 5 (subunit L)/multisubunit Na+/H+ antiporter MnhA subunit